MGSIEAKLVIIRGLPGSGKSTLAKEISSKCGYLHLENDMFFHGEDGYHYEKSKLTVAQNWCLKETANALRVGKKVVVANVFTKVAHMKNFLALASSLTVIECRSNFGNVHNVPIDIIQRMRDSWEFFDGAVVL